jgi:non-heme chloroperoxidase
MKAAIVSGIAICALAGGMLSAQRPAQQPSRKPPATTGKLIPPGRAADGSLHQVFFVPVERNIKLEVLDWGGVGRPIILLEGWGYDAHVWDKFAPKLIDRHHVYAITRRGFGASSAPAPPGGIYTADRLGDDVLAVMNQLGIERPVLVGHAKAGQELSSIGSRYPDKVSGLIYLDAAYSYAFYDSKHGDLLLDTIDLRNKLDLYLSAGARDLNKYFTDLQTALPMLERDVKDFQDELALMPDMPAQTAPPRPIMVALGAGAEKFTEIHAPALAIFAAPHNFGQLSADDSKAQQAIILDDFARTSAQADAFQAGVPGSRVVRIPNASHMIFESNEADVLREMNAFIDKLR